MKVFISWSGDLSKELGEALRDWIPAVVQQVRPYFTPNDIEKGARWSTDISQELEESAVGIICLTRENLEKPWIMFEAGALSKQLDSAHVCPLLFGVDTSDVQGPLVQFQATAFGKSEVKKLLSTINNQLGERRLDDSVLDSVFRKWWPELEEKVEQIIARFQESGHDDTDLRTDRELIEEILALSRMSTRRARHAAHEPDIDPDAFRHLARLYLDMRAMMRGDADSEEIYSQVVSLHNVVQYLFNRGSAGTDEDRDVSAQLDFLEH